MRPYSSQWPHMYLFVAAFHVSPQNFMQGTWYFIEAGKKLYSFSLHCVFLNGIFLKIFFNFIYVVSSYARVRSELLGVISGMLGVTLCFHTGHHVAALGSAALRQSWRASSSGPQEKQPFSPPLRFEWGIFFFFFYGKTRIVLGAACASRLVQNSERQTDLGGVARRPRTIGVIHEVARRWSRARSTWPTRVIDRERTRI